MKKITRTNKLKKKQMIRRNCNLKKNNCVAYVQN